MASNTLTTAEDFAVHAAADGIGTVGTDIFIDFEPAALPDSAVAMFYNSGGFDPLSTKNKTLEKPTVQAIIVGKVDDPVSAQQMAQKIKELFTLSDSFTTAGGTRYTGIWQQGSTVNLGNDANRRPQYSLNFRAQRTYA